MPGPLCFGRTARAPWSTAGIDAGGLCLFVVCRPKLLVLRSSCCLFASVLQLARRGRLLRSAGEGAWRDVWRRRISLLVYAHPGGGRARSTGPGGGRECHPLRRLPALLSDRRPPGRARPARSLFGQALRAVLHDQACRRRGAEFRRRESDGVLILACSGAVPHCARAPCACALFVWVFRKFNSIKGNQTCSNPYSPPSSARPRC